MKTKIEIYRAALQFTQDLGGYPCPDEVYKWLIDNKILDKRRQILDDLEKFEIAFKENSQK